MTKLKLFDLCAGIGGFSYALAPIATTVAYAEKDATNQLILKKLMAKGVLSTAPVYDDVTTLTKRVSGVAKPDIIAAGFPCQDLSSVGNRVGLYGPRSSLFFTVCDVVKAWDPDFVLFENVPQITEYIKVITRRLKSLGYTCTWDLFTAWDLGAPHFRKRWYCLCRKSTAKPIAIPDVMLQKLGARWSKTPSASERCISGSCKACQARRFALGNSIVPQCARHAFLVLHNKSFGLPPPAIPKFPEWNGKIRVVPPAVSADNQLRTPALTKPLVLKNYHTPRAGCWYPPRNLSKRGLGALPSQLVYQDDTPKLKNPRVNPNFVEWMMGYPKNYTALPCPEHGVK